MERTGTMRVAFFFWFLFAFVVNVREDLGKFHICHSSGFTRSFARSQRAVVQQCSQSLKKDSAFSIFHGADRS